MDLEDVLLNEINWVQINTACSHFRSYKNQSHRNREEPGSLGKLEGGQIMNPEIHSHGRN